MNGNTKRVVVWGTGFVGRMVIPEVLRHPAFELVGVGVNDPDKVGSDVGELCGIGPVGLAATPRRRLPDRTARPTHSCTSARPRPTPTTTSATSAPSSGPASTSARRP